MNRIAFLSMNLGSKEISGIHRNTLELLRSLDRFIPFGSVELLIPKFEIDNFGFKNIVVKRLGIDLTKFGSLGKKVSSYLYRNFFVKYYVSKNNVLSVDLLLMFPKWGADVICVYDCIPEIFKDSIKSVYTEKELNKHFKKQRNAINKARYIITDSECAKRDIRKIYSVEKKIFVIPCGWQHFERVIEDESVFNRLGIMKGSYYFSLGSKFPHKNFKWISAAAKHNPNDYFVVSGLQPRANDLSYLGEKCNNVLFTGYLSDGEVKSLMRYCKAFIQPSLYEGFGIPPMEAMSVGANCIVSNAGALPEVYKKSVWYINPLDYENIDLDRIMSNHKDDNSKILDEYSWEISSKRLFELLINN